MQDDVQVAAPETTEVPVTDTQPKAAVRAVRAKRQVPRGNIYVHASYNNTFITATDPTGNVLAWSSAGSCNFRGPRKATPYAASVVVRELARKLDGTGFREANVFVDGVGTGREASVRALHANGMTILSIKDVTPIPHNGCRSPKPRRI